MQAQVVFLAFASRVLTVFALSTSGCTISINKDLKDPQPLLLYANINSSLKEFYWPDPEGTINLQKGSAIELACPDSNLNINGESGKETGRAICEDRKFIINRRLVNFNDITCEKHAKHTSRYANRNCFQNNKEIEIGFNVGNNFLKTMEVCLDRSIATTFYTKFTLHKNISGYQIGYPRSAWSEELFPVVDIDKLYSRNVQRRTINSLLGLDSKSYKYIKPNGDYYLARGHLAAKADFIYGSQQRTTFYHLNAAPQWQTFNGENWNRLEQSVRDFAASVKKGLIVYTGTYGIATLPHAKTSKETKLYLYVNGKVKKVPVPRLFWKVLYEPNTKAGIAFVGLNNPYRKHIRADIICEDLCRHVGWLKFNRRNETKGYVYCCGIEEFRKTVKMLPEFTVEKLLA